MMGSVAVRYSRYTAGLALLMVSCRRRLPFRFFACFSTDVIVSGDRGLAAWFEVRSFAVAWLGARSFVEAWLGARSFAAAWLGARSFAAAWLGARSFVGA